MERGRTKSRTPSGCGQGKTLKTFHVEHLVRSAVENVLAPRRPKRKSCRGDAPRHIRWCSVQQMVATALTGIFRRVGALLGVPQRPCAFQRAFLTCSRTGIWRPCADLHDFVLRSDNRVLLRRDTQLETNDSSLKHADQQREPSEPSNRRSSAPSRRSAAIWAASSSLFGVGSTWTISGDCAVPRRSLAGWPCAASGLFAPPGKPMSSWVPVQ